MMDDANLKWHATEIDEAAKDLKNGYRDLSKAEAEQRLHEFLPNNLEEEKKTSTLKILFGQFKDIFVLMLLAVIGIPLITVFMMYEAPVLEDYSEAIAIGVIVAIYVVAGFVQEYWEFYRGSKMMQTVEMGRSSEKKDKVPMRNNITVKKILFTGVECAYVFGIIYLSRSFGIIGRIIFLALLTLVIFHRPRRTRKPD